MLVGAGPTGPRFGALAEALERRRAHPLGLALETFAWSKEGLGTGLPRECGVPDSPDGYVARGHRCRCGCAVCLRTPARIAALVSRRSSGQQEKMMAREAALQVIAFRACTVASRVGAR